MKTITKDDFTRIINNSNAHPRYVLHFFKLLTQDEINSYGLDNYKELYNLGVKRANKIGGKKFHNKQYGGGIVFTTFEPTEIINKINSIPALK